MNEPMPTTPVEIYRKGTHPIYKYSIRQPGGWHTTIMIDEDYGNVLINHDTEYFGHWWGPRATGEASLRRFLSRDREGYGYFEDKFSYSMSRWNPALATESWKKKIAEAFKENRIDEEERDLLLEDVGNIYDYKSSEGYHMAVMHEWCQDHDDKQDLMERVVGDFPYDTPSGEGNSSPVVKRFIERTWDHFVQFLQNELAEEEKQKGAATNGKPKGNTKAAKQAGTHPPKKARGKNKKRVVPAGQQQ